MTADSTPPKHPTFSRRGFLVAMAVSSAAAVGLALEVSPLISVASEAPAGLSTSFESWFEVEQPPAVPFEIVQRVVEFPVGARAARHLNGGPAHLTVLDGELTMWIGAAPARTYTAGESFVEPFGEVAEAANQGSTAARLLVTYLIPAGAAVSMREDASAPPAGQPAPTPSLRSESRLRIDEQLAYSQVGHLLQTYQAGARTMSTEPQTARLLTVVSGEVTVLTGGGQQTYSAGQHWIESPGQAWRSENPGSSPAVVAVSATRAADDVQAQPVDALAARLKRTEVQRSASSVPGREIVQVVTEIPVGAESGWHTHPGEEVGYIVEGTVEMMVEGQPTRTLQAGNGFLIPPRTPHNALDVGPGTGVMLSTYIVEVGQPLATFTG